MKKKISGFTLVELMIVITIISILIALILTGVHQAQNEALDIETSNNLKQCAIAVYAYAKNHGGDCPDNWSDLTGGTKPYIDNAEATKNATGSQFDLTCAGDNLYQMGFSEPLISDTNGPSASGRIVYVGGHVGLSS